MNERVTIENQGQEVEMDSKSDEKEVKRNK